MRDSKKIVIYSNTLIDSVFVINYCNGIGYLCHFADILLLITPYTLV